MRPSRGSAWCVGLSLIGIGLAGFLYYLHLGMQRGELLGGLVCSSGVFNCHAVTASAWGSVLGMPLALWGILGYLVILALALFGRHAPQAAAPAMTLIFVLSLAFVAADVILLSLMAFVIRFFCVFCLLTYVVNLSLVAVSARSLDTPWSRALSQLGTAVGSLVAFQSPSAAGLFWGMVGLSVAATAGLHQTASFFGGGPRMREQFRTYVMNQAPVAMETGADPRIGSPSAPIQMIEFSDFFCPACQNASKFNTIILASHRDDTVFIFKHFPLDTACNDQVNRMVHPGACRVAAAAECAHLQGQFWPFHDLVFERGKDYNLAGLDEDARRVGLDVAAFQACLASGQGMEAVKRDIVEAAKVRVQSTPTYVLNGLPMAGGMSPAMFEMVAGVMLHERPGRSAAAAAPSAHPTAPAPGP